jgi:CDP-glucose 4,6-dehydratase
MVTTAYRRCYFPPEAMARHGVGLASARAGNVIGGGDVAPDRIVPDIMRALAAGAAVRLRNPRAVRPWQHVLHALTGYQWPAASLAGGESAAARAWNFGPVESRELTVGELVERVLDRWGEGRWVEDRDAGAPREAPVLRLDCSRAVADLNWQPVWSADEAIDRTVAWHRLAREGSDMAAVTARQIADHTRRAAEMGRPWAAWRRPA